MRHNKRRKEHEDLQRAYEEACNALRHHYTKKLWRLEMKKLSRKKAMKIWRMALIDTGTITEKGA